MRNFRKILIICIFVLNGCAVSQKMWNAGSYRESFKSYFIDEKNNAVVLIGENMTAFKGKENYHYSVKDKDESIEKAFRLSAKIEDIELVFRFTKARGAFDVTSSLWVGFDKKILSDSKINFLQNNNFKVGNKVGYSYENPTIIRYPASKEFFKNYKILPLHFESVEVFQQNTSLQTAYKTILTPFTLAADILLFPITIPHFIYHQIKESQTNHFCEGDFCGYDKIPEQVGNKVNSKR